MLTIRTPYPGAKRIVVACFGAAFIAIALLSVSVAPWRPSVAALFHSLAIIPFVLGLLVMLVAALDLESEWRVDRSTLVVIERTLFHAREHTLTRGERRNATIVEHEWESAPRSYSVDIRMDSGHVLRTYDTRARSEAEAWLAAITGETSGR
jgi:hypothetical protein